MTPIDWGVLGALLSTCLAIVLPWMMKAHAQVAVAFTKLETLEAHLAAMDAKLDQLVEAEHRRTTSEALWENRLQTLEAHCAEAKT